MRDAKKPYTGVTSIHRDLSPSLAAMVHDSPAEPALADLIDQVTAVDSKVAEKIALTTTYQPSLGTEFCGFQLLEELGRGAFSRVYLAEQLTLACRYVALKVSSEYIGESQTLAQLQHTNIVPIFSVHQSEAFHAICMPYLGRTTLKDVQDRLQSDNSALRSGGSLFDTMTARRDTTRGGPDFADGKVQSAKPEEVSPPPSTLTQLQTMSFVDSVLWVFSGIARGLHHAHARGILHRDLKPANVLLCDDGEPMLLDFNLSQDTKDTANASQAVMGGTLPYMSPEQLRAYRGEDVTVDERADIYSLGIMLCELLSGNRPYPLPSGSMSEVLDEMVHQRVTEDPTKLLSCNRNVTPAVAAIVRRCLEPEPTKRYASARQLLEDIECQLSNRPLLYTPEAASIERLRKWTRRHPAVTSNTSIALVSLFVVAFLAASITLLKRETSKLRAAQTLTQFETLRSDTQFHLEIREPTDEHLFLGLDAAKRGLATYGVLNDPNWMNLPLVSSLSDADRKRLRTDIGEMLQLMSWAQMLRADTQSDQAELTRCLDQSWELCVFAESTYAPGEVPRAVILQKAELLERRGDLLAADNLRTQAQQIPLQSARDYFLVAREHFLHEEFEKAATACRNAVNEDRQNMRYWFLLGRCYDSLNTNADAIVCYTVCTVLRPTYSWAHFNLGLSYYRQREYQLAIAAFDKTILLDPDLQEAYVNRALAKQNSSDLAGALADLDHVIQSNTDFTRVYFIRSRLRKRMGDETGSKTDLDEGLKRVPKDETSWVSRGIARLESSPLDALQDFNQALDLNSRSRAALQNKARVLSEFLDRPDEAIEVLNQLLRLYPSYARARGGRGVLLARRGERELALADARACLAADRSPEMLYQVACIYALNTRQNKDDIREAMRYLNQALRLGFGRGLIQSDPDLEPIRNDPAFQKLVAMASSDRPRQ